MITKKSVLKKMINKKVFVITNFEKCEGYIGTVDDIKNEDHLIIKNDNSESKTESIFNIRSIPYEF